MLSTKIRFKILGRKFSMNAHLGLVTDPDPIIDELEWSNFKKLINSMGLTWDFTERSTTTIFMDLKISIMNGRFSTTIYSKPMSLHLYIPPSSCHAPGIATSLIFGHTLRVFRLCSKYSDINKEISLFYKRLIARGYSPDTILPLLARAEDNARDRAAYEKTMDMNEKTQDEPDRDMLFYHLPFHPSNPSSSHIQKLWRDIIATPTNAEKLTNLTNHTGHKIPISKLTVAYSRPPNLGNLLSCRKVKKNTLRD